MDIEGLGDKIVDGLVAAQLVTDPADLYDLTIEQLTRLDRLDRDPEWLRRCCGRCPSVDDAGELSLRRGGCSAAGMFERWVIAPVCAASSVGLTIYIVQVVSNSQ